MHKYCTYLFLIVSGFLPLSVYCAAGQDTIPPVFTLLPQDQQVSCDADYQLEFDLWFSEQAFAEADFGEAQIFPTLSQSAALAALDAALTECNNTGGLEVGFFATDSCGNNSDSTYLATFSIVDVSPPSITTPAQSVSLLCDGTTSDSLLNWINGYGGAMATDNCGDSISWTNYSWIDNLGNSGFSSFTDTTNIVIRRDSCQWSISVSFFISDDCGNNNFTVADFSIIGDTELPEITFSPADTVVGCASVIPDLEPIIIDGCDNNLELVSMTSSTQGIDSLDCTFYNYEVVKTWLAEDVCGNSVDTFQTISIRDTIAPYITAETSIAVDCDTDLNTISDFASADDDCSEATLEYSDRNLFNSACQNQIERTYYATDLCGNIDSFTQIIQVQDFKGPEFITLPRDTIVNCNSNNINNIFNQWLASIGGGALEDNCNTFTVKGLPAGVYGDTMQINTTAAPTPILNECLNIFGALSTQQISFVAFDNCGNITQREALFSIIDPTPPLISACPDDFALNLSSNQCTAEFVINLPEFSDNCLTQEEAKWQLNLNGIKISDNIQNGEILALEVGDNLLEYTITDCGGNSSSCIQSIQVRDTASPLLVCPENQTIQVSSDECSIEYDSPELLTYQDNCIGVISYSETLPSADALLNFNFNPFQNLFKASDFTVDFKDIQLPADNFQVLLTAEYKVQLGNGSRIDIRDESNRTLISIEDTNCTDEVQTVNLNLPSLNLWLADSEVRFLVITNAAGTEGTQPCNPASISDNAGSDGESYIRLNLSITEVNVLKEIEETATGIRDTIMGILDLAVGDYIVTYSAQDASENTGTCSTSVTVVDNITPFLFCNNIIYEIDPLLEDFYPLVEADLNYITNDNCGIKNINFGPRQIFCSDLGSDLRYTMQVEDVNGNIADCEAEIQIIPQELNPEFLSGLCFDDTLKLVSNLPPNIGLDVKWSGPNNFSSSDLNPVLTGITGASSGLYFLQVVSSAGCEFAGNVEIDINQFDSPEIFSNQADICLGESVLLNTNSFTEIVDYFWYEGLSPNGTLVGQTSGPSLSLTPTQGSHLYYVEVEGNNCNSRPSNTLEVTVTAPPVAEISNPFSTLCEGDDLNLMTDIIGVGIEYEWTGPNNYSSNGRFPEVITEVTENNQGNYTLVIKENNCVSDTAVAQVFVFPNPPKPIIEAETIFCEGQTAVLSVSNVPDGTRFSWFNDGVFFSSVNSNSLLIPSISAEQSGFWSVVAEEGSCISDTSETFLINVESSLNIGATNDGPHCVGDSVLLTCSFIPGATYNWEDPNGINFQGRIVSSLATEGVYTVTITTASNCTAVTNTQVEVGDKPEVTAVSNTSLPCMSGDMPITLVPTVFPPGNYTYLWDGPNNFSSSAIQPIIQNANEEDNGLYTLTVIQGNCESLPGTTTVDIELIPDVAELTSNTNPCPSDEVKISIDNPVIGADLQWIWTTPNGQVITDSPELIIPVFEMENNGAYSVIQEKNSCRSENSNAIEIAIQTMPIVPLISGEQTACVGEDITLTVQEQNADQYIWFTPNGTLSLGNNELVLENIQLEDAGSYSVNFREGNCESATSTPFQLEVLDIPEPQVFEEDSMTICRSALDEIELCIQDQAAEYDNIILIDKATEVEVQTTISNCFTLSFLEDSPLSSFEFSVVTETNGCRSSSNGVVVIDLIDASNKGAEIEEEIIYVCDQDFISITTELVPSGTSILWQAANPNIEVFNAVQATVSVSNLPPGANEILLISTNEICAESFADSVIIYRLSEIAAEDDNYEIQLNESITIDPLSNDELSEEVLVQIIDTPAEGTLELDANNSISYQAASGYTGTVTITYEVCYLECDFICDQAEITILVDNNIDCFVGNVITPNGDGYNDFLEVPCLAGDRFNQNKITILNQWGDEIYSAAPYDNSWAGSYKGKALPSGTYFYILDLGDGTQPLQGFITLEL